MYGCVSGRCHLSIKASIPLRELEMITSTFLTENTKPCLDQVAVHAEPKLEPTIKKQPRAEMSTKKIAIIYYST